MGIGDFLLGRTDKQRAKRAEKMSARYRDHAQMTPEMLHALAWANDEPTKEQVDLYVTAVPAGTLPREVLFALHLSEGMHYVCVLFDDGITLRWGTYEKKEFRTSGADLPFWGMEQIAGHGQHAEVPEGIVFTGSDGTTPYRLGVMGAYHKDLLGFMDRAHQALTAYRARPPQQQPRAATRRPDHAPVAGQSRTIEITPDQPPATKLANLEVMRQAGLLDAADYERMRDQFRREEEQSGGDHPAG